MALLSRLVSKLSFWREQRRILRSFTEADFEEVSGFPRPDVEQTMQDIEREMEEWHAHRDAARIAEAEQTMRRQQTRQKQVQEDVAAWQRGLAERAAEFQVQSQLGWPARPSPFPEATDARGQYIQARLEMLLIEVAELQAEWSANYTEKAEPPIALRTRVALEKGLKRTVPKQRVPVFVVQDEEGRYLASIFRSAPTDFYGMMHTQPVRP